MSPVSLPSLLGDFDSGHSLQVEERMISFKCPDRHFRDAVVYRGNGEVVFTLGSKTGLFTSWSNRRSLFGAQQNHILDIRQYKSSFHQWVIEDPQARQLAIVKDRKTKTEGFTYMDAQITAGNVVGGYVAARLESTDLAGSKTILRIGETRVAEMRLVENNDKLGLGHRGLNRSAWEVEIVGAVDLALLVALMYCRAAVLHTCRR